MAIIGALNRLVARYGQSPSIRLAAFIRYPPRSKELAAALECAVTRARQISLSQKPIELTELEWLC